jgi:hypothetical protein
VGVATAKATITWPELLPATGAGYVWLLAHDAVVITIVAATNTKAACMPMIQTNPFGSMFWSRVLFDALRRWLLFMILVR